MRVAWLQAVAFESLGTIEPWLRRRDHQIRKVALWDGEALPSVEEFDVLIAMGGAAVPTDESHYPWIEGQLDLLRSATVMNMPVLGICLGAQLLAHAFGSPIRPNRDLEIGWHTVCQTREGLVHPLMSDIAPSFMTFHWHQDTVMPPPSAVTLASSKATKIQAFAIGTRALGVQFHPEIDPAKATDFSKFAHRERSGQYAQSDHELMSATVNFDNQPALMDALMANLLRV